MEQLDVAMIVNGAERSVTGVPARTTLADFLRERLGLTGTRLGCEHGVCGACTVLLDEQPVRSCLTLAVACEGREVTTVEGLDRPETRVLRSAFSTEHGLQCGFCTAGMLMTATDFLERNPSPNEQEVREALSGNICRCTGYAGIVRACLVAAEKLSQRSSQDPASLAADRG